MKKEIILKVKRLDKELELPQYINETDVGFDLRAAKDVIIKPHEQKIVPCGIIVEIPKGYVGYLKDRAGIVTKLNVHVVAGTIDSGYRGEVSVVLFNLSDREVMIEKGMRIAQMIIIPVIKVKIEEADKISKTKRSDRGFGSTGIKEINKEDFEEIATELKKLYEEGMKNSKKL
ncbi:MAG: dUTP diphosphatase [Candidatus Woesearchaeota archaeon]